LNHALVVSIYVAILYLLPLSKSI